MSRGISRSRLEAQEQSERYPHRMRALPTMLVFVLLLAACGESTSSSLASTTSPPTTAPPAPGTTSAATTTPTSAPTATVTVTAAPTTPLAVVNGEASILVYEGLVEAPGRLEVNLGTIVSLRVDSDISDEIHVHGY